MTVNVNFPSSCTTLRALQVRPWSRSSGEAAARQLGDSGAAAARAPWWHGATRDGLVVWSDSWAERCAPIASDTQRGAVCARVHLWRERDAIYALLLAPACAPPLLCRSALDASRLALSPGTGGTAERQCVRPCSCLQARQEQAVLSGSPSKRGPPNSAEEKQPEACRYSWST